MKLKFINFFLIFSLGFHCPLSYNPADFFIKILSQAENKLAVTKCTSNKSLENVLHASKSFNIEQTERTIDEFILTQCQKYVK